MKNNFSVGSHMSEKYELEVKYKICVGLHIFLKGCVDGCRSQWEVIKKKYEEKSQALLFNCFLYSFCQNRIAIILDHSAAILNNQELKDLKSKHKSHFKPFKVIANGMKHLNNMIGGLIEKSESGNIQFYNFFGTKITFGDASVECISEEPLKKTEMIFEKAEKIISEALLELQDKISKIAQNV